MSEWLNMRDRQPNFRQEVVAVACPATESFQFVEAAIAEHGVDVYTYNSPTLWWTCNSNRLRNDWHIEWWLPIPHIEGDRPVSESDG